MKVQSISTNNSQNQNNCQKQPGFTSMETFINLRPESKTTAGKFIGAIFDTGDFGAAVKDILKMNSASPNKPEYFFEPATNLFGNSVLYVYDGMIGKFRGLVFNLPLDDLKGKIQKAFLNKDPRFELDLREKYVCSQASINPPANFIRKTNSGEYLILKRSGKKISSEMPKGSGRELNSKRAESEPYFIEEDPPDVWSTTSGSTRVGFKPTWPTQSGPTEVFSVEEGGAKVWSTKTGATSTWNPNEGRTRVGMGIEHESEHTDGW